VILQWEISALPVIFMSIFEEKMKNHLGADLISDFIENTTLVSMLFYQKIKNIISPQFFPIILFPIVSCDPKTTKEYDE